MLEQKILDDVKNLGVSAAAYFDVSESEVRFDPRFRKLCENNTCGSYGRNYMCPPSIGSFEDCRGEVLNHEQALVIETIHPLEDSFDYEGMMEGGKVHSENVNKVWKYIKDNVKYDKLKILSAGGCSVCSECGIISDVPCRFPDAAVSSVEGHGIDAAHLAESHGLKYINGEDTVTYIALYLLKY